MCCKVYVWTRSFENEEKETKCALSERERERERERENTREAKRTTGYVVTVFSSDLI